MPRLLRLRALSTAIVVALLVPASVTAQGPRRIDAVTFTANVALTTTSETVVASSNSLSAGRETVTVIVIAWAQLTTGASTTAVTPRIRRGNTTSGTLVGEANAETLKAAAGGTEPFWIMVTEDRTNVSSVQYSLTLQQTGASADGSALQGGILTMVR